MPPEAMSPPTPPAAPQSPSVPSALFLTIRFSLLVAGSIETVDGDALRDSVAFEAGVNVTRVNVTLTPASVRAYITVLPFAHSEATQALARLEAAVASPQAASNAFSLTVAAVESMPLLEVTTRPSDASTEASTEESASPPSVPAPWPSPPPLGVSGAGGNALSSQGSSDSTWLVAGVGGGVLLGVLGVVTGALLMRRSRTPSAIVSAASVRTSHCGSGMAKVASVSAAEIPDVHGPEEGVAGAAARQQPVRSSRSASPRAGETVRM